MSNHLHSFLLLKVSLNTKGYYFEESKKKKSFILNSLYSCISVIAKISVKDIVHFSQS